MEAAPAAIFSQDIDSILELEDLVPGEEVTFRKLGAAVSKVALPQPAEELTLSALLNVLGSHAANRLAGSLTNPTAAGFQTAVGEALRNGKAQAASSPTTPGASRTRPRQPRHPPRTILWRPCSFRRPPRAKAAGRAAGQRPRRTCWWPPRPGSGAGGEAEVPRRRTSSQKAAFSPGPLRAGAFP